MRGGLCLVTAALCALAVGASSHAAPPPVTVIGDSVLTGVLWYEEPLAILERGLDVQMEVAVCRRLAAPSCTFEDVTPPNLLALVKAKGTSLGPNVVVEMGYNDSESTFAESVESSIDALLAAHVQRILWATLREARHPYVRMNDVLVAAARRHPEVTILDWNKFSRSHPEWFQNDGLHLEPVGGVALATFLHDRIVAALQAPSPLQLATAALPPARAGRPYAARLVARGGRAPYRWTVAAGALPRGLRLDPAGRIVGKPAARARVSVAVRVADAAGRVATRRELLVVR
jgi:putative Ig domain-containing protein